jgi:hypothetical protein
VRNVHDLRQLLEFGTSTGRPVLFVELREK